MNVPGDSLSLAAEATTLDLYQQITACENGVAFDWLS
jgi:hypothetical protein